MKAKINRVVWDSCVIIDAIQKTPDHWDLIGPFLVQAESGSLQIVISEVVVAEVMHLGRFKEAGMAIEEQAEMIRQWLMNPYIVRRPVVPRISELAAEVGRKHNVKGAADCIVVATALSDDIELIHTFDGDSDGSSNRKLLNFDGKIGAPALRIMRPSPDAGPLFEKDDKADA